MKALSVKQPWAWAIIHAGKDVENRTWTTNYRGPLLIHASKTFDKGGYLWFLEHALCNEKIKLTIDDIPEPEAFQMGGIIGKVNLKKMVRSKDYSPWMFGPRGWVLEKPEPMKFIPHRGQQGLFNVPDHIPEPGKKVNPDWCMNRFECNINDKSITSCLGCGLHFRNIQI
jgi:hypothetical protein